MSVGAILLVVFSLMLVEARVSTRNERALRRKGAIEPPDDVYRAMQVLYPVAFLAPAIEGWLRGAPPPGVWTAGFALFVGAKALKYWVIRTLGERWTFKVLVPPGSHRTRRGPYRVLAHPNYVAVAAEILGAGFLVGGPVSAIILTAAFGALILRRIRVEERALSQSTPAPGEPA
jgi:methyltransferase